MERTILLDERKCEGSGRDKINKRGDLFIGENKREGGEEHGLALVL